MTTRSMGKKNKQSHLMCRRCGKRTFHKRKKKCSACGFGPSSKIRTNSWQNKTLHGGRRN